MYKETHKQIIRVAESGKNVSLELVTGVPSVRLSIEHRGKRGALCGEAVYLSPSQLRTLIRASADMLSKIREDAHDREGNA
jgi:hypothetical protein